MKKLLNNHGALCSSLWADAFFWLHSGDKTWYGLLVTSGCLLSRNVWWVDRIGRFCPKLRYFTDQDGPKGGSHQNGFWPFSNKKKWMLQTFRVEKVAEKNGVICLVSMFPSCVMVCKLSKKVYFLQFCADLSIKSTSVEAICIYGSESSHYTLSKNAMVYRGLRQGSWDISN